MALLDLFPLDLFSLVDLWFTLNLPSILDLSPLDLFSITETAGSQSLYFQQQTIFIFYQGSHQLNQLLYICLSICCAYRVSVSASNINVSTPTIHSIAANAYVNTPSDVHVSVYFLQCDQMAKLFVEYLAIQNNENLPNSKTISQIN